MSTWNSVPRESVPAPGHSQPVRRLPYPSDLSDSQWRRIEPLLPGGKPMGRHRCTSLRDVVNGIQYRWSTGCVWRMLPHDFPPWTTVYTYYRQWQRDGTLVKLRQALLGRRAGRGESARQTADRTNAAGRASA